MRYGGKVVDLEEMSNAYNILAKTSERKNSEEVGVYVRVILKWIPKETELEGVDWIYLD
jgi:hypothetical protein